MENNLWQEKNLVIDRYAHGGSRIYLDDGKSRKLLCDTYSNPEETERTELREVILQAVQNYIKGLSK